MSQNWQSIVWLWKLPSCQTLALRVLEHFCHTFCIMRPMCCKSNRKDSFSLIEEGLDTNNSFLSSKAENDISSSIRRDRRIRLFRFSTKRPLKEKSNYIPVWFIARVKGAFTSLGVKKWKEILLCCRSKTPGSEWLRTRQLNAFADVFCEKEKRHLHFYWFIITWWS